MQDIVVDLPIGTSRDAAIAYAVSVAKNTDFPARLATQLNRMQRVGSSTSLGTPIAR